MKRRHSRNLILCTVNKRSSITVNVYGRTILKKCSRKAESSHSVLTTVTFLEYCMYSQQTFLSNGPPHIVHSYCYCSCAVEWWDVRTPGAILNVFDFLEYTYFHYFLITYFKMLVSFASLAEIYISREISVEHPSVGLSSLAQSREISIEHPSVGLASLAQL